MLPHLDHTAEFCEQDKELHNEDLSSRLQKVRSFVKGHTVHQKQSLGLAPVSRAPGLVPDHPTFLCSIKAKNLKVVLGDQDLKKTEFHEQTFGVEEIFKYSHYHEQDEIPYNDIGKSLLAWTSCGSCPGWISLLMES